MRELSRRIFGLGFLTSLLTIASPALAASKPPISCRFIGQKTTYKGRVFTCVRVKVKGKTQLAWDSGKAIPVAELSSTPSPTPSAVQSKVSEPIVVNKIEIPLGKSSEVPSNGIKIFTAKNRYGNTSGYVVVRDSNGILAMSDICAHKGCSVEIQKEGLVCPCHNALFDPKNGDVLRGPASYPLDRVPVHETDGIIYVTD